MSIWGRVKALELKAKGLYAINNMTCRRANELKARVEKLEDVVADLEKDKQDKVLPAVFEIEGLNTVMGMIHSIGKQTQDLMMKVEKLEPKDASPTEKFPPAGQMETD